MAFNPFSAFRKHSKKAFAILTIIIMFVFIMSGTGGSSDPIFALFGGRGSSAPEVARLNGRKIHGDELEQVRRQRRIANEYMSRLVSSAGAQFVANLAPRTKDMDPIAARQVNQVLQFRQMLNARPISSMEDLQLYRQLTQQGIGTIEGIARGLELSKKSEEAELIRKLQRVLETEMRLVGREMFFEGTLRSGQGILDYMIWKSVADQRGIKLTSELVAEMIRTDALGLDVAQVSKTIESDLHQRYQISPAGIMELLADEYRVRIAQTAVLGGSPLLPMSMPSYVTPHEFAKYYRDARTTVRVNLLPINVESYLSKVSDKPNEGELRELYTKYKNDESVPFLDRPGFKDGKKVKVEWVGLKGEQPAIKQAALEQARKESAQAEAIRKMLFSPPLIDSAGILGRIGALWVVNDPKLIDKRIDKEYEVYVSKERATSWVYSSLFLFGVHDRSLFQPQTIATGVAAMLAGRGTAAPLQIPVAWGAHSIMEELKERVRFGMLPFALSGQGLAPMLGVTDLMLPQPLSRDALVNQLTQEVTGAVVKDFLRTETTKFQEEVAKKAKEIKKAPANDENAKKEETAKKAELAKYIDEFVKKYGLTHGTSSAFHDRYSLVNDAGVKPLKEFYFKDDQRAKSDPKGQSFGTTFFDEATNSFSAGVPYRVVWFENNDPTFASFAKPDDAYFLVWKTEEEAPKVRTFEAARADVELAWKTIKARDLAKKDAEDLQKQLRDKAIKNLATLKDFAAEKKLELVEVGPFARANERPALQPGQQAGYAPPEIPQDKVPYQTFDFASKLVDLRDKPIGETIMLPNMPQSTFYVGVLTERTEPSDFAFQMAYVKSGGDPLLGSRPDILLLSLERERREKLIRETIEQLRTDARLQIVDEELVKHNERGSADE